MLSTCAMVVAFGFSLFLAPPAGDHVLVKPDVPLSRCSTISAQTNSDIYYLGDRGGPQATLYCRPALVTKEECEEVSLPTVQLPFGS